MLHNCAKNALKSYSSEIENFLMKKKNSADFSMSSKKYYIFQRELYSVRIMRTKVGLYENFAVPNSSHPKTIRYNGSTAHKISTNESFYYKYEFATDLADSPTESAMLT